MNLPFKTLPDLLQYFNHEDKAQRFLEKSRWPDGVIVCPICGVAGAYRMNDMKNFKCRDVNCKARFSVTVGTVMENSKLPLCKWFAAIWLVTNHKKGISSCQLARDLGIGQKAAWFMNHRIRAMVMDKAPELLEGVVMADEAYVGGKFANMNKTKRTQLREAAESNKTPVMGLLEKDGKVKLAVIGNNSLKEMVRKNVDKEAVIVTDEHSGYSGLNQEYSKHVTVNHSNLEFMKDGFTTNPVEGVFSLLKRSIIGIYHQVHSYHLHRYCTETAYRYNTRKIKQNERFADALSRVNGRLKYKDLIMPKPKRYKGIEFIDGE